MKSIELFDDGIEYVIIGEKKINNVLYTLFANSNDPEDICFRKTVKENDEEFFVELDNTEEVLNVLKEFTK